MKIIVNASIFNAFAGRLVGTSATYNALAVQKGLATAESMAGSAERALSKVPFFNNVKETATKIMNISKTENEVVVEINDQYIIGSINLAFNLYDRIADSATTMLKEMGEWDKETKAFEAEWSESPKFDTSSAWSKVCEEVANSKVDGKGSDIIKQAGENDDHFGTTEVSSHGVKLVAGEGKCKTVYAPDVDKQVVINALKAFRDGESLPYDISTAVVACICQSESNMYFYVGGVFDLPISVINAVRELYDLPLFPTKEEVESNEKDREVRRAAEFKAEQESKKAQDNQQPE